MSAKATATKTEVTLATYLAQRFERMDDTILIDPDWDSLANEYHGDTYIDRDPISGRTSYDHLKPTPAEELDAGHGW